MRPLAQTGEARNKDLAAFVRALGRAESAPEKNPELVRAIRAVIQLYASPPSSPKLGKAAGSQARRARDVSEDARE